LRKRLKNQKPYSFSFRLFVVFRFTTKFVIMLCKFNDVVSVVEDAGTFISDNINSLCRRDKAVIKFEQFNKLFFFGFNLNFFICDYVTNNFCLSLYNYRFYLRHGRGIRDWKSGIGRDFCLRTSVFLCQTHFSRAPYSHFIWMPSTIHDLSK